MRHIIYNHPSNVSPAGTDPKLQAMPTIPAAQPARLNFCLDLMECGCVDMSELDCAGRCCYQAHADSEFAHTNTDCEMPSASPKDFYAWRKCTLTPRESTEVILSKHALLPRNLTTSLAASLSSVERVHCLQGHRSVPPTGLNRVQLVDLAQVHRQEVILNHPEVLSLHRAYSN